MENRLKPCGYSCNCWMEYPNENYKQGKRWSCRDEYEHIATIDGKTMCKCKIKRKPRGEAVRRRKAND